MNGSSLACIGLPARRRAARSIRRTATTTWDINDKLQLSGGINNLFNWGPPIVGSSAGYGNTWPATYDPYGQTFFFNARLML
jgi:outer membrane receptor for ferrienterochelin and colicin